VVEYGKEPAEHRAAAAAALMPTLDDEGRARVRIAAQATTRAPLRIALDAVAAGDRRELGEALEELELEDRQLRASGVQ
jgi:hypothetical protein